MTKKFYNKLSLSGFFVISLFAESLFAQGDAAAPSTTGGGASSSGNNNIVEFDARRKTILNQETSVVLEDLIVDNFDSIGKVGGSYTSAALLSNRDFIYLDLKGASVSVGDRFAIYEDRGAVSIPGEFNKSTGHHIRLKGFAEVTKVVENAVIGQIYDASLHIEIGDKIAPISEVNFKLAPKSPNKMVKGKVLAGVRDFSLIAPHDFAFINKGAKDGLEVNDRLFVYRTSENDGVINLKRPAMNTAELIVVNTGDRIATVYCLTAQDAFSTNAAFKSAISEVRFLDDKSGEPIADTAAISEEANTDEFEGPSSHSYASFGLGIKTHVNRDGAKGSRFSFAFDFGGENWGSPLQYTIQSSNGHEISWAPQWRLGFNLFPNLKRLFFRLGLGPVVLIAINSSGRNRVYSSLMGIQVNPQINYFLSDQFFITASPLVADIYFWQYLNRGAGKGADFDMKGAFSNYLSIGMTF